MSFQEYYHIMQDGTIKHINPFTGTEVWNVPGRGDKPITNIKTKDIVNIEKKEKEDYCAFCSENIFETPPEKERLILDKDEYKIAPIQIYDDMKQSFAYFKRTPNLFEIVTYNYWKENYNYKIPHEIIERKHKYLSDPDGQNHVLHIINKKLEASSLKGRRISDDEKLDELSNPFFAGCHELIIGGRHYTDHAKNSADLCSSGELSLEEHEQYIHFTIHTMERILEQNRFVRYVAIFQNWLAPAGASFDHLHKQLVGLDEWGTSIESEIKIVRSNRNAFNEFGANLHGYNDLIFAENDYAIAFAEIGHRFPSIAIYSKSIEPYITKLSKEEVKGMSDLLHACHKAMGNKMSYNEEWYYTPYDSIDVIPWHILLKWRVNTPAGFEGGTKIYINPISPIQVRDKMVPELFRLREEKKIAQDIRIAEECQIKKNPLLYYRYSS